MLCYYFGISIVINIAFGIWGLTCYDSGIPITTPKAGDFPCDQINRGLFLLYLCFFVEAIISLMLSIGFFVIMRSAFWSCCALTSFGLFAATLCCKFLSLVLATVWTWGENSRHCRTETPQLYDPTNKYLIGVWAYFGFQMTIGTFILLCSGLDGAINEGMALLRQDDTTYTTRSAPEEESLVRVKSKPYEV